MVCSVHRLSRILLTCPAQVHFHLLACSITSVTFVFSLTQICVLCQYFRFNILLSIFACAACSLLGWWVSMFPGHMSLLEVCMSCRLVSSSIFNIILEDVAVLGEYCTSGGGSSLNLLVLVFVSGTVYIHVLCIDVAVNVSCVVFHHHAPLSSICSLTYSSSLPSLCFSKSVVGLICFRVGLLWTAWRFGISLSYSSLVLDLHFILCNPLVCSLVESHLSGADDDAYITYHASGKTHWQNWRWLWLGTIKISLLVCGQSARN